MLSTENSKLKTVFLCVAVASFEMVGRIVLQAISRGVEIHELSLEEIRSFSDFIEADVYDALSLEKTLATKSQAGGTSPARVREATTAARGFLTNVKRQDW